MPKAPVGGMEGEGQPWQGDVDGRGPGELRPDPEEQAGELRLVSGTSARQPLAGGLPPTWHRWVPGVGGLLCEVSGQGRFHLSLKGQRKGGLGGGGVLFHEASNCLSLSFILGSQLPGS